MKPKKSLGQNFLVNRGILEKIISSADLLPDDIILEIGPGKGILTEVLASKAGRVIAVEKDHQLIEFLRDKFKNQKNIEIIEDDILKFDPSRLPLTPSPYKIVANIPYYITSHLLKTIFGDWPRPKLIILMVQKEVAQRICAKPGDMNILALSVQYYAEPKIVAYVSKGSFRPAPKVDSAILRLTPRLSKVVSPESLRAESSPGPLAPKLEKVFFQLIKTGFSSPRKKLLSNLRVLLEDRANLVLDYLMLQRFPADVRAEKLSLEDWLSIANIISTETR